MRIYYRISDGSYPKEKLPGTSKEVCLRNFMEAMGGAGDQMTIVADNCGPETLALVHSTRRRVVETHDGNAGSLRSTMDRAIAESKPKDLVYFVEDDYLHRPGSAEALIAADEHRIADYFTVYDHPDKYSKEYGRCEHSAVMRVGGQHWRYTQSTTMTFACRANVLSLDRTTWEEFIAGDHPQDHRAFSTLVAWCGRRLAVAIPGLACHVDLTWGAERGVLAIETWAMEMMARKNNNPGEEPG